MTCRHLRRPSCRAPQGQQQLAIISWAASKWLYYSQLTANLFHESGKHGVVSCQGRCFGGMKLVASLGTGARGGSRPRPVWGTVACSSKQVCTCTQSLQNMASLMLRGSKRFLAPQCLNTPCLRRSITRRYIATTPASSGEASSLPLAGIKVLDMTRVLAGVSYGASRYMRCNSHSYSRTARKYWEILGTHWATLYEPTSRLDAK